MHDSLATDKLSIKKISPFVDLTLLDENADKSSIVELCQKAQQFKVAAVCIFPNFVKLAKTELKETQINIATVCNFPSGNLSLEATLKEIDKALNFGADEIDVVMPYSAYLKGEQKKSLEFIKHCKQKIPVLKVIMETGAWPIELITPAAKMLIENGVNFLKTSTGKIEKGATLDAVKAILLAIKNSSKPVGLKISGGIRTLKNLEIYWKLVEAEMGPDWINANTFRIGTSRLLDDHISP